jgi:hypothetical protein
MYEKAPNSPRMKETLEKYNSMIETTGLHYPPEYIKYFDEGRKGREV